MCLTILKTKTKLYKSYLRAIKFGERTPPEIAKEDIIVYKLLGRYDNKSPSRFLIYRR